jgi:hypothetical protein
MSWDRDWSVCKYRCIGVRELRYATIIWYGRQTDKVYEYYFESLHGFKFKLLMIQSKSTLHLRSHHAWLMSVGSCSARESSSYSAFSGHNMCVICITSIQVVRFWSWFSVTGSGTWATCNPIWVMKSYFTRKKKLQVPKVERVVQNQVWSLNSIVAQPHNITRD